MPVGLIGGLVSGGASLLSGILGSSAASKAAQQQAAAGKAAASQQTTAGTNAQGALTSQLQSENANANPYLQVGEQGASALSSFLQQPTAQPFAAPTAAQAEATPGYQFSLQQGLQSLQNSAAARGGLLSTGTAKNLTGYAEGLASTNYQNTYNNALQAYQTNLSANNQRFNQLYSTTGLGANTAASLNSTSAATSNALANNFTGNAQVVGNDIMGVGNAQAAGTIGSTNALTSGITGAANTIGQAITLQQLIGSMNASTPSFLGT